MHSKVASKLSNLLRSYKHFMSQDEFEEYERADDVEDMIEELVKDTMPSGSGFDSGTTLDIDKSKVEKLVFHTSFHHMNEVGMYDVWTEHTVTATPSFLGHFDVKVGGRDRNQIKDYIGEVFYSALLAEVE